MLIIKMQVFSDSGNGIPLDVATFIAVGHLDAQPSVGMEPGTFPLDSPSDVDSVSLSAGVFEVATKIAKDTA